MLAARAVQEQGVHVEGLNFFTGFCVEGHTQALRRNKSDKPKRNDALWVADQLGIQLHIIDVIEEYKNVVLNPQYGYGAHMNPCLDCKIFMVKKAREWARDNGFDFIITGEVIGQRPKSQRRDTMPVVQRDSGSEDRLLRPLCAQRLPETLPEREGWVDRQQLFDFSGRNRTPQMKLAEQYGFQDYASPAGGCCFLTDETYSRKLKDLWQARNNRDYELDDIMLLKVGRHLRPKPEYKLIIGREEGENNFMQGYARQFATLTPVSCPGPLTLVDGSLSEQDYDLAARIVARFSQHKSADAVTVKVAEPDGVATEMAVTPLTPEEIPAEWYV